MTEVQIRRLFAEMLENWTTKIRENVKEEPFEHIAELMWGQAICLVEDVTEEDAP